MRSRVTQGDSRLAQALNVNKLRHDAEGRHSIVIEFRGSSELTISGTAYLDPPNGDAFDDDPDQFDASYAGDSSDEHEDKIGDEAPGRRSGEARPRRLIDLKYGLPNPYRWDIDPVTLTSRADPHRDYEAVLHAGTAYCSGGREHRIRLDVVATVTWPEADPIEESLEFVVKCLPAE